jgi:DNA-binding CsgD family transcriptional regulator
VLIDNRHFRLFCFGPNAVGLAMPMTEREQECYNYKCRGYGHEAIANRMSLSIKRVQELEDQIRFKGWL